MTIYERTGNNLVTIKRINETEHSWSPITGCTKISEGCRFCFAERVARRLAGRYGYPEAPHHFNVTLHPDRLDVPLIRKKPTVYSVCSMSDLFHKDVPPWFACEIWQIMRECPQHTFQILTKRPRQMLRLVKTYIADHEFGIEPLSNVWLGVSVENQAAADERIPILLQIPAAVRFVSAEPLLGMIDLDGYLGDLVQLSDLDGHVGDGLDWVIVGGESGPGARPMHPQWVRDIRDQCQTADTPFFFKQWGAWRPTERDGCWSQEDKVAGVPNRWMTLESEWCTDFGPLGMAAVARVGKKAAGRLLDGREWNEMPNIGRYN